MSTSAPNERGWLRQDRLSYLVTGLVLVAAFVVAFHRNAWVGDDAYVTFRSVEQLHAGNGPRWNPHERVQGFTHPLWFGLLAATRLVSENLFHSALVLSLALSLALVLFLPRILGNSRQRWLLGGALLLSSRAWVDYSWSGLENPLTYLLLALFVARFLHAMSATGANSPAVDSQVAWCALWFGLLTLCRPDNALLCLPALAAVVWRRRSDQGASLPSWLRSAWSLALGLLPLILWELFSLAYYGSLIPNTAYAKLNTGIPASELWLQGLRYLHNAVRWDWMTPAILLGGMLVSLFRHTERWLGAGVLLHLLYVLQVGGDFMAGRFLGAGFLVAVLLLLRLELPPRLIWVLLALALASQLALPSMPLFTPNDYRQRWNFRSEAADGIADEKGYYYGHNSWRIRSREPLPPFRPRYGVVVWDTVGFFGYGMPHDTIVVDRWALTDPFLARLPAKPGSRIGHFERELPAGYLESLRTGQNLIQNPELHQLYETLRTVTAAPLLSPQRARAIWKLHFETRLPQCQEPPCGELEIVLMEPNISDSPWSASTGGLVTSRAVAAKWFATPGSDPWSAQNQSRAKWSGSDDIGAAAGEIGAAAGEIGAAAGEIGAAAGEIVFLEGRNRRLRIGGRLDIPIATPGQRFRVLTVVAPRSATLRYVREFELPEGEAYSESSRQRLPGPGFEIVLRFDGREQRRRAAASLELVFDSNRTQPAQLRSVSSAHHPNATW